MKKILLGITMVAAAGLWLATSSQSGAVADEHDERELQQLEALAEELEQRAQLVEHALDVARDRGQEDKAHVLKKEQAQLLEKLEHVEHELAEHREHREHREHDARAHEHARLEAMAEELAARLEQLEVARAEARSRGQEERAHALRQEQELVARKLAALEREREEHRRHREREEREEHGHHEEHEHHEGEHDEHLERRVLELEIHRMELEMEKHHLELDAIRQEAAMHLAELAQDKQTFLIYTISNLASSVEPDHAAEMLSGLMRRTEDPVIRRVILSKLARLHQEHGRLDQAYEVLQALMATPNRPQPRERDREEDRRERARDGERREREPTREQRARAERAERAEAARRQEANREAGFEQRVKRTFAAYDKNKDQRVGFEEWLAMKEGEVNDERRQREKRFFQQAAGDDGWITLGEFARYMSRRGQGRDRE